MKCSRFGLLGLALLLAQPVNEARAQATGVGPAMLGVKEVVLQYAHVGNGKAADACGISREDIAAAMLKLLKSSTVPVIPVIDAKPASPTIARIELVPEIATLTDATGNCMSWVALSAQGTSVIRLAPVQTPRNITITYWRSGFLVSTNLAVHARHIVEGMVKLSTEFSKEFDIEQPPVLPSP